MLKIAVAVGVLNVMPLSIACAMPQQMPDFYRSVERGHTVRVIGFYTIDPNCKSLGRTIINLLTPPRGGSLSLMEKPIHPKFQSTNIHYVCNKRLVPATNIYYTALPYFSGEDSFTVESVDPNGFAAQSKWTVHVQ